MTEFVNGYIKVSAATVLKGATEGIKYIQELREGEREDMVKREMNKERKFLFWSLPNYTREKAIEMLTNEFLGDYMMATSWYTEEEYALGDLKRSAEAVQNTENPFVFVPTNMGRWFKED